jgi:hypothetical protein
MSGRLHRSNEEHLDFFHMSPPYIAILDSPSSRYALYALRIFDSKPITLSKPSARRGTEPDAIADEKPKGSKGSKHKVNGDIDDTLDGQEG